VLVTLDSKLIEVAKMQFLSQEDLIGIVRKEKKDDDKKPNK
jgi:hypothetical protein